MIRVFFRILRKKQLPQETMLSSLAPKILTKKEELDRIQPYLDKLNDTLNTKGINNIALTGGYGSGKSTILKTFQHWNKNDYNFLNISLAAFNQTNTKENFEKRFNSEIKNAETKKKVTNELKKMLRQNTELERQLEISILQQIVYKVKPSNLSESRFKRIVNIPNWKLWGFIPVSFILWIGSMILLVKYNYLDKLNPNAWTFRFKDIDWAASLIFLFAFLGIGYFSKLMVSLFSNSKINKVNLKGEIEIGDNSNKSILNEHYDEILYYFEKNHFNVVVIEDLDRFDNTNIFTKLRELNILLNNADTLKNKSAYKNTGIKFLYAVGDDLFDDKKERVKFFEYIIPVIPFINSTNTKEQLKTLLKESDLEESVFSKEFLSDITTFIDDIDMRLLVNIFHEFVIYRNVLNPNIIKGSEAELFAMITYKNIDPEDFNKLNNKEGKLYSLINNKRLYIKKMIDEKIKLITDNFAEIENIKSESINNIKELRQIYINQILTKLPNDAIYFSEIGLESLKEEANFERLITKQTITYRYRNSSYYEPQSNTLSFEFSEIEKEVSPDFTFKEREKFIESKHNNGIDVLHKEIEKLKKEKAEIEDWDLKQIFREVDIDQYLSSFSNNGLLRNLFLEGYINENYNDYISLFYEGTLTKEDKVFERNLKSGINTKFDYGLKEIENLVNKIDLKYFGRDAILNYDLLDFLGGHYLQYSKQYDAIIKLLSNEKERSIDFIDLYIEKKVPLSDDFYGEKYIKDEVYQKFIKDYNANCYSLLEILFEKLVHYWIGLWEFVYNSNYKDYDKDKYLFFMLYFADVQDVLKQNSRLLKREIENYSGVWDLIYKVEESKLFRIIRELDIKVEKINDPNENTKLLLDHIHKNRNYQINKHNILLMLKIYGNGINEDIFERSNYSTIIDSNCTSVIEYIKSDINTYVENLYLNIEENKFEKEEGLIDLLNNGELSVELKSKIVQKVTTKISDINDIRDVETKRVLLVNNKVIPKWDNVTKYYSESKNEIDQTLIGYLNFRETATDLSKLKLSNEDKNFEISLILCNGILDENYNKLLNSCFFSWNGLNFESLSINKVDFLINKKLNITKANYDLLKKHFKNSHIKLLEKNFTAVLEKLTISK